MTSADLRAGLACSFCMKLPGDVARMVAGPGVYICNECVDLCGQIISSQPQGRRDGDPEAWHTRLTDDELLAHLPKVAAASTQVELQLTGWVREARSRGITWTRIGEALGMTTVGDANAFVPDASIPVADLAQTTQLVGTDGVLNIHAFSYRTSAAMINQRVINETAANLAYIATLLQ